MAERLLLTLLVLTALVGLTFYVSEPVRELEQHSRQTAISRV